MPYPKNLQTAKQVEAIVRENGAVPATIAILDGTPCIGVYIYILVVFPKFIIRYWTTYFDCFNCEL